MLAKSGGGQFPLFTEKHYFKDNPGEQVHLQFLRWYLAARTTTHKRIVLQAANRLPIIHHWLERAISLWHKLASVDADSWIAHRAFVENVRLWRHGSVSCWAARLMAHLRLLGVVGDKVPDPAWNARFDPAEIGQRMDEITRQVWDSYKHVPYRSLSGPGHHCQGRTLYCFAQYFSHMHEDDRRHVYHNTPAWQWRPIMQLATGQLLLNSVTAHWRGDRRSVCAVALDAWKMQHIMSLSAQGIWISGGII